MRASRTKAAHTVRARTRGFTLIEVICAIALTAIVVTLAATALDTARASGAHVRDYRATAEAESRWRIAVADMLRHAPPSDAVSEPLLQLADRPGGRVLTFLSRGVVQPFGTGRIWRVRIAGGPAGVTLDAEAVGRGAAMVPLHSTLTSLRGLDVEALEGGSGVPRWRRDWPIERSRPLALRLTFAGATGREMVPLAVDLAPLSLPLSLPLSP